MWPVIGYILLSLLGLGLLLLLSPLVVRVRFRDELTATAFLLGIPIWRYNSDGPKKEKKKPKKKAAKPSSSKPKKQQEDKGVLSDLAKKFKTEGIKAFVDELERMAQLAKGVLKPFVRIATVDRLCLHVTVASSDASQTAQDVGRVCAAVYPAVSALHSVVRIRKRDISVMPDFLAQEGMWYAEAILHGMVIRVLWAVLRAFAVYIKFKSESEEDVQNGQQAE